MLVQLTFDGVRNNISHGLNWFSAMPNEIPELHDTHQKVLAVIKDPKSFHGKDYDPHLTLLNSRDLKKSDSTTKLDIQIKDNFIFAVIDRNEVGQAFKIIRPLEEVKPVNNLLPSKM